MFQVYGCIDKDIHQLGAVTAEIPVLLKNYRCLWIDIGDEGADEAQRILEKAFGEGIRLCEISGAREIRILGACTEVTLVLLPIIMGEKASRLRILANPKVLATMRSSLSNALVEETLQSLKNLADSCLLDVDLIFCRLLEETVDSNEFYIDELRDTTDELESKAVLEEEEILVKVKDFERNLGKTHDLLQSQRIVIVNSVQRLLPDIGKTDASRTILLRAERRLERQLDLIDHYDHELVGVVNLNDLTLTIRLTRIMTLLTIVSTVLLLPNTIATFFGIPSLPVPSQTWALVTIITIVSGIIPTIYLYKKGWLKL